MPQDSAYHLSNCYQVCYNNNRVTHQIQEEQDGFLYGFIFGIVQLQHSSPQLLSDCILARAHHHLFEKLPGHILNIQLVARPLQGKLSHLAQVP